MDSDWLLGGYMANDKTLPDIQGTDAVSLTWRRLLTRDRNVSNLFSGTDFTTDQDPTTDIGRPNWRTDLNRMYIYTGATNGFVSLFSLLTPQEIAYSINNANVPSTVDNVKAIIDLLVQRANLNTVTLPPEGVIYTADGSTLTYNLPRYTSNKASLFVFIDGVKQAANTYTLNGDSITFQAAPNNNEIIEIIEHSSLTEWDYSPNIQYFTGDGSTTDFTLSFDVLNVNTTSVNVAGVELQKDQFSIIDTNKIRLVTAPANNARIQVQGIGRTSYVTVSSNSIDTDELKNGCVTNAKLNNSVTFDGNKIVDLSISSGKLANSAITTAKLANSAVTGAKIANNTITRDKLASDVTSNYYTKAEIDALLQEITNGS